MGFISWDVTIPGATAQFDIANETGPNSSYDATAPVTSRVRFQDLALTVDFSDDSERRFDYVVFLLNPFDGLSFESPVIPIGGGNPQPLRAVLTGTFSTDAITEFDGAVYVILPGFSSVVFDQGLPLTDGSGAIIFAQTVTGTISPEPSTFISTLLTVLSFVLFWVGHRRLRRAPAVLKGLASGRQVCLMVVCLTAPLTSKAQVLMNVSTQPSSGTAGVTTVNAIGSRFPTNHGEIKPSNVTIFLAASCGGGSAASTIATSLQTVTGSQNRVGFLIPASLTAGTYFVTLRGTTSDGTAFASEPASCSELAVTHTSVPLSSCPSSGSLAIYAPASGGAVTAYAPNGCWDCFDKGVRAVTIEGVGSSTAIATPNPVNSCSSNPNTGQTVCVANNTDIYLIKGTTLTDTLHSSSNGRASFSGGTCNNCGVAVNALTNQAVITVGLDLGAGGYPGFGSGFQILDLNTKSLSAPYPSKSDVSEAVAIDAVRGYIVSPDETNGNIDLFPFGTKGLEQAYSNRAAPGQDLDSAAVDCATGIAVAPSENTISLYITDLTQAKLTAGASPGWAAPQRVLNLTQKDFPLFPFTGIAVAQGTSHLAVMAPEFQNDGHFAVLQLPSSAGSGTPDLVDWAVSSIPGLKYTADPHAVTAYTSPNDGKAYAVLASGSPATALARIDLACVLALPRDQGKHTVAGSSVSCVRIIPTGNAPLPPPVITSTPVNTAGVGQLYKYTVAASDQNGFALSFALATAPPGMVINTIDQNHALIQWVPDASAVGSKNVTVTVQNLAGLSTSQSFQLTVSATQDQAPVITSSPVTSATVGQQYSYQVRATDPTNSPLTFILGRGLASMSLDAKTGLLQWTPTAAAVGTTDVTIIVQNSSGLATSQSFRIVVPGQNHPPLITSSPVNSAIVGQQYSYQIVATDPDADPLAYSPVSAPVGMSVDSRTGLIHWTPSSSDTGDWDVIVQVRDPGSLSATQRFSIHVSRAYPLPAVSVLSPTPGALIGKPVEVVASIPDPVNIAGALNWTLDLVRGDSAEVRRIGAGIGAVAGTSLGRIDPTLMIDNSWDLVITMSKAGQVDRFPFRYEVSSGNLKLGNFKTSSTDITIPVAGIPMVISREYDSLDTSVQEFGAGWRLGLPGKVVDSASENPMEPFTPKTRVYVTRPDGRRVGFLFTPTQPTLLGIFWRPKYTPDPGVTDTLESPDAPLINGAAGFDEFLMGPYNPTRYWLTTKEGIQYEIDEVDGLRQITDRNGNTLTVTPEGLKSSTGLSLPFERDAAGRITRITEPAVANGQAGSVRYAYDGAGNLISFFDQMGNETKYFYDDARFPHYLTRIVEPLNRPVTRNVFNAEGRLIALCDANGNINTLAGCQQISSDSSSQTQTIVNAGGFRTDYVSDDRGNVRLERHWLDAVNHLDTERTFNANNNLLTEKDPAGNVTTRTYDSQGNLLTQIDSGGHTQSHTYLASCNLPTSDTDAGRNTTTYTYDANCNLRFVADPVGAVTEFQYNSLGQPTKFSDPVGNTWALQFDANGFPSSRTDPFGNTTQYQFSTSGDLQARVDRLGRRIAFAYDATHNLVKESWADGHTITVTYDAAAQMSSAGDLLSQLTLHYDPVGRIQSTMVTVSDGPPPVSLTYDYDLAGNLVETRDSLGGATSYSYDALDRLSSIQQFGVNIQSKRVELKYDSASLLQSLSRFADLGVANAVASTGFAYECGGCSSRLTSIIHQSSKDNSLIDARRWKLDDAGNILQLLDADGSHAYSYDAARRLLTASHNPSSPLVNEFYGYDPAGNRLSSHLSGRYDYSYKTSGAGNRLLATDQFTFRYDNEGNLTSKRNAADGTTTTFTYDYRNRLTAMSVADAEGRIVNVAQFVYDYFDRRIAVAESGQSQSVVWDGANPILKLTPAGTVISRRFYLPSVDGILADESGGQTRWFLTDQVGTVHDLIANSGNRLEHYTYDSFGQIVGKPNPNAANDLLFTSREFVTNSDLGYYRARYYSPSVGRFTGEDPLLPFSYDYVRNNPLLFRDLSGEADEEYPEIEIRVITPLEQRYNRLVGSVPCQIAKNFKNAILPGIDAGSKVGLGVFAVTKNPTAAGVVGFAVAAFCAFGGLSKIE